MAARSSLPLLQTLLALFMVNALLLFGGVHALTLVILHILLILAGACLLWRPEPTSHVSKQVAIAVFAGLFCLGLGLIPVGGLFSASPASTLGAISTAALVGGFALCVSSFASREDLEHQLETSILVLGYGVAIVGLIHVALGMDSLFGWVSPESKTPKFVPPFVNANHTATFAVWALATMLALPVSGPRSKGLRTLGLVLTVILFLLCGSVGACCALVGVGWFWITRKRSPWVRWAGGIGLAASGLWATQWVISLTRSQWEAHSFHLRAQIWKDSLQMIREHPIWGSGAGTYQEVYRALGSHGLGTVSHAHSEPLHWWVELGIPGVILGGVAAFWFFRQESRLSGLRLGLWYGVLGVLLHSFVDFPLHMPAIALLVAASVALLIPPKENRSARSGLWIGGLVLILQAPALYWTLSEWQTQDVIRNVQRDTPQNELKAAGEALAFWAPWRYESKYVAAILEERFGDRSLAKDKARAMATAHAQNSDALRQSALLLLRTGETEEGATLIQQAIDQAPKEYRNWAAASWAATSMGKEAEALESWKNATRYWPRYAQNSPLPRALSLNPFGIAWLEVLKDADLHWSIELGDRMMQQGEYHTAILAYEQAQDLSPVHRDLPLLGLALVRVGEAEKGLIMLNELMVKYPDYPWIARNLALALSALERHSESADAWMKAAQRGQGDEAWKQCIRSLDKAIASHPGELERLRQKQARCQALCESCNALSDP